MSQPYDPVPPYDLDDVEANAESYHSQPPTQSNATTSNDVNDVDSHGEENSNIVNGSLGRDNQRPGKLTERECCDYAFLYFKTAVLGVVAVAFFIIWFAYLGRRRS
jgi:hypothetical protein